MRNGTNTWNVPFSHIMWLNRLLEQHDNLSAITRSEDILFEVTRKAQGDNLRILCLREYTMGLTMVQRAQAEFGHIDIIYIGGGWNSYTMEAKQYCLDSNIGMFISGEMAGALWKSDFWNYHKKDREGNPIYSIKAS
ncbi:hypothetical protein Q4503_13025 [Colwellia sp. 6_MG-2023]|uniref:hypothetical protein n=1 Tax=Colwellia sp. 6_MG-2023 TaxID=3062676 RepID=UPI0026E27865|nr:hypothetical protein [Colwellia sp. 6_MG-2023]MDO6488625.1 hypothetical protein [Colwellia sp. 6_MG-2023]